MHYSQHRLPLAMHTMATARGMANPTPRSTPIASDTASVNFAMCAFMSLRDPKYARSRCEYCTVDVSANQAGSTDERPADSACVSTRHITCISIRDPII